MFSIFCTMVYPEIFRGGAFHKKADLTTQCLYVITCCLLIIPAPLHLSGHQKNLLVKKQTNNKELDC